MIRSPEVAPDPRSGEPVLHLVVRSGDPVSGTIAVDGESGETPFCGWIELMAAINAARGGSSAMHDSPPLG